MYLIIANPIISRRARADFIQSISRKSDYGIIRRNQHARERFAANHDD